MSEMNKDFDRSFEQQWQDIFEGAELSPSSNLWDDIEQQLPPNLSMGGRQGFMWTAMVFLMLLSVFLLPKTTVPAQQSAQIKATHKTQTKLAYQQQPKENVATIRALEISTPITTVTSYSANKQRHDAILYTPSVQKQGQIPIVPAVAISDTPKNNLPADTASVTEGRIWIGVMGVGKKLNGQIQEMVKKTTQRKSSENAVESITSLGMIPPKTPDFQLRDVQMISLPEEAKRGFVKNMWATARRGVVVASPKLDIRYDAYMADYVKMHGLETDVDLSRFFADAHEDRTYSFANQGDISIGVQLTPKWQFTAGLQYRVEFLEQTTNAFFVNYYDYSRHSFLIDILEGNLQNPNFAQALQHHPAFRGNGDSFTISQFNQQGLIHISSQFEYIGVPMQIGYSLRPAKRFNVLLLGSAQVDKLFRSSTSSLELQDDVAITYHPNTATKLSTWSWQIGGGLQAEYNLSEHWGVTATSIFSQNIKPIKENAYVVIKPQGLQTNLGVKYTF